MKVLAAWEHCSFKMWIWWPSKVLNLKPEYSNGRFSAKFNKTQKHYCQG